ncbi:MAG: GNAT family N-acetyltransferase [Propionicimonas sp.]
MTLAELPTLACPYCGRVVAADTPWAVAAATRWGWCGVKLTTEDHVAGLLLLAPLEETGHAMLMSAWVGPASVRSGYGKQLVQAASASLLSRKVRVIVARGSRRSLRCSAPPRDFLKAVGFVKGLDDRLWRLDLDRTVADRSPVRGMFDRLIDSLRPVTPPEPAGGAISGRTTHTSS